MPRKVKPGSLNGAEVCLVDGPVRLVNVGPDHSIWKGADIPAKVFEDCIVHVQPASDTPESLVASVLRIIREDRPRALRFTPQRRNAVVPNEVHEKPAPKGAPKGARDVVMELAEQSSCPDKAALVEALEQVMSEEGL